MEGAMTEALDEISLITKKQEYKCGIVPFDVAYVDKCACVTSHEIFDNDTFECLFCPEDMLKIEFYQKVGFLFGNLCNMFKDYLANAYDVFMYDQVYAFMICEHNNIRGCCGYENKANSKKFKMYINPLICTEADQPKQLFAKVMTVALHEVTHAFLHCVDSINYAIDKNFHDPLFFQIYADIDEFFFDRDILREALW